MTNKPSADSERIQALHPRAIRMGLERVLEHRKLSPHLVWLKPRFSELFQTRQAPQLTESDDLLIQSFAKIKDHEAQDAWIDAHLQRLLHS